MARERAIMNVTPCMFRNHPVRFLLLWSLVVAGGFSILQTEMASRLLSSFLGMRSGQVASWLSGAGLVLLGLGAIGLFFWWLECCTTRLKLMPTYCVLSKGLIARHMGEMGYRNVQNTYVKQNIVQRILGVGSVGLSSSGQSDVEIVVHGVKRPTAIQQQVRQVVDAGGRAE